MLTDQSIPGMQGSELAKYLREIGHRDLIIIGVTADIYALDSRHQFLAAGMNSVLIKPLSLMTLENELSRYFKSVETIPLEEEYSFEAFGNLLQNNPRQILVILEEIGRVQNEILEMLNCDLPDETSFKSMVHKVKGGAQLLQAKSFIANCQQLEKDGPLLGRISSFKKLLEEQNKILEIYKARYRHLS
jgi:two-component system sensor histidine kinase EvgS